MVFSGFYQEDGKHTACWMRQVSSYLISTLWSAVYARARTFMWMFEHRHVCARIYANILACMRVHRKMEYAFCPRRCRMAHTCRRPAESITVIRRSENREREREKRWNREQRGLTPPPDIVISSFSHHTEEEENNAQHRHLEHSLTAAQSALSANRRKRKIKEQRGEEREGRGERYRHQRR